MPTSYGCGVLSTAAPSRPPGQSGGDSSTDPRDDIAAPGEAVGQHDDDATRANIGTRAPRIRR